MEIIIYDRNLYRLGTIENHTSLQWHRKYYECGTFELHAPATEKNIRLLQPGNVIRPKGKDEAAVIRGDQTEEESTLVNEVVRNGYFLPIYFNDRLTGPMFTFNGTCEDAIAFKVYIISTLEQITSPVTVKLTNKTTGTMQTVTVTKSQMGFYVTEAGEYTVEADLESVMVTPKAFKVTNDNLMTTQNITLREGSNMGYIGNYIGSFIAQ